ncbi:MAG: hypothetical protein QOF01_1920 [Thermomicrobiales bacterium]|nr:hypothetical protein [Thermomicrobiales bacterium]
MPTYESEDAVLRDFRRSSADRQELFLAAVEKFVVDLARGDARPGLRIIYYQRREGVWEMTWPDDGRAPFLYGPSKRPGDTDVLRTRVGDHEIVEDSQIAPHYVGCGLIRSLLCAMSI